MVKRQTATFREARSVPPFWAARFEVEFPPAPGRFMLAELGGPLREALFPAASDAEGFTVWAPPRHPVTQLLPGAPVDMLGPLGRGFRLGGAQRLLLVAEAARLPPLLPLLEAAPAVVLIIEAPTRALLPPARRLPPTVELHLITQDGSAGQAGTLENCHNGDSPLDDLLKWTEQVCFSCDPLRYPALAARVRRVRLAPRADFAQALVLVDMPCGVGACDVCRVKTRHGERHACVEGPVFDLLELDLR